MEEGEYAERGGGISHQVSRTAAMAIFIHVGKQEPSRER